MEFPSQPTQKPVQYDGHVRRLPAVCKATRPETVGTGTGQHVVQPPLVNLQFFSKTPSPVTRHTMAMVTMCVTHTPCVQSYFNQVNRLNQSGRLIGFTGHPRSVFRNSVKLVAHEASHTYVRRARTDPVELINSANIRKLTRHQQ